jgi:hypothetical protein
MFLHFSSFMFLTDISLQGVDLLAGVEAIISHLIVKEFKIPCAHAPAVLPPPLSPLVCPRSAAEEVYVHVDSCIT